MLSVPFDLAMQDIAQQGYLIRRYVDDVAVITANKETAKLDKDGLKLLLTDFPSCTDL